MKTGVGVGGGGGRTYTPPTVTPAATNGTKSIQSGRRRSVHLTLSPEKIESPFISIQKEEIFHYES